MSEIQSLSAQLEDKRPRIDTMSAPNNRSIAQVSLAVLLAASGAIQACSQSDPQATDVDNAVQACELDTKTSPTELTNRELRDYWSCMWPNQEVLLVDTFTNFGSATSGFVQLSPDGEYLTAVVNAGPDALQKDIIAEATVSVNGQTVYRGPYLQFDLNEPSTRPEVPSDHITFHNGAVGWQVIDVSHVAPLSGFRTNEDTYSN